MKKGKAIEDNQLDNVQGGYVLETPTTTKSYFVINKDGSYGGMHYADKGWAQHIAREKGESDRVITIEEYKKIFGHYPPVRFDV